MGKNNQKLQRRSSGLVAYLGMPLAFTAVGLALAALALGPAVRQTETQIASLFQTGEAYQPGELSPVLGDAPEEENGAAGGTGERQQVVEPNIGEQYGRLVCERLGMDVPVYFGDNDQTLDLGVGTYPASWIPGCGRTTLWAGHAGTFCAPLEGVAYGDVFRLTTDYGEYEYHVSDFRIVQETDVDACRLEEEREQVVLYTCYPFYATWHVPERFFVYLEKVSGPEIELTDYHMKD